MHAFLFLVLAAAAVTRELNILIDCWVMSRGRVTRDSSWQWWARAGVVIVEDAGPRAAAASLLRSKHNKAENINYIRWHRQPAAGHPDSRHFSTFEKVLFNFHRFL